MNWDWKSAQLKIHKKNLIKKNIKETASYLNGKLPDSKYHKKRNSGAHVYQMIKSKFKKSYKDVKDLDALLEYITWIRDHPC